MLGFFSKPLVHGAVFSFQQKLALSGNLLMRIILIITNTVLINLGFLFSFLIRYGLPFLERNFFPYKKSFLFLMLIYISALAFFRVYKSRFRSSWDGLGTTKSSLKIEIWSLRRTVTFWYFASFLPKSNFSSCDHVFQPYNYEAFLRVSNSVTLWLLGVYNPRYWLRQQLSLTEKQQTVEYRIIAVNKAGDGEPSNTAMVVL